MRAKATADRFGHVLMRQLVYKVQRLLLSLIPFCWDFGQLSPEVERLYINQLVNGSLLNRNARKLWEPLQLMPQPQPPDPRLEPCVAQ